MKLVEIPENLEGREELEGVLNISDILLFKWKEDYLNILKR